MYKGIGFKVINTLGLIKLPNLNEYHEVKCDPTYNGDAILYCSKEDLSFDEVMDILLNSHHKYNILGAMSYVYWKYTKDFFDYLTDCDDKIFKILRKKTSKYICRWFEFVKRSDDSLYPQNNTIRSIYILMENKEYT